MQRLKMWITANEKWAGGIAFLLNPRAMADKWRRWISFWSHQERDRRIVEEMKRKIPRGYAYLYLLAWCGLVFATAFAVNRPAKYPIETHHNVYVWSQVKGNDHSWWVSGDDLPLSKWTCCPDFNCTPNVWSGYIAATAKYEERGACKSIRASGLGWFWKRDEFGNVQTW